MANFNRVMLMGNLTRDPELKYIQSGSAVCNLRMAINRKYRSKAGEDREEVCYVGVVVWQKQAENVAKYLRKGSPLFVEGRLQSRSWETDDGQKRSTLEVVADRVQFLSSGQKRQAPAGGGDEPFEGETPEPGSNAAAVAGQMGDGQEDDVPF